MYSYTLFHSSLIVSNLHFNFNLKYYVISVGLTCDCPPQPYSCPADSKLIEIRVDDCCVKYECVCQKCPLSMQCGIEVIPIPEVRGNQFPGSCCPDYTFNDIDECKLDNGGCSDICMNLPLSHSCSCPTGQTLQSDSRNCGVCSYMGQYYALGDITTIGCNYCICQSDSLSGERWSCPQDRCQPNCQSDGLSYPVGAISNVTSQIGISCTCIDNTLSTEWNCEYLLPL